LIGCVALLFCGPAFGQKTAAKKTIAPVKPAVVGEMAPNFTLVDTDGETLSLNQFKGKTVVLEWFNPDCPFVKVVHNEGRLSHRARMLIDKDGMWLGINSGAAGQQGHGLERNAKAKKDFKLNYPILLDADGKVGRLYGATRTPQVFVIDAKGLLVYAGAVDSSGGAGYGQGGTVNHLNEALLCVEAGQPVATPNTKAWGCSVKYAR
jgi:peroxiredoxin